MKRKPRAIMISLFLSTWLLFIAVSQGFGEDYEALKGLKSVKAVFDVRVANQKNAALNLKLIHDTCMDKNIMAVTKKPAFVVIFIGPSVKLISNKKEGF